MLLLASEGGSLAHTERIQVSPEANIGIARCADGSNQAVEATAEPDQVEEQTKQKSKDIKTASAEDM